jgi:DNA-binding transcriptional LysR family regulator
LGSGLKPLEHGEGHRKSAQLTQSFDILKSLEIFLSVSESGSMTIASRRLGVTQSAISQQIKLLESDLGATLFDRQSRPLRLTTAGITLHQRAGRLVSDAKETWVCVAKASGTLLPNLRVALLSTLAPPMVPALLSAVHNREIAQTISIMRGISRNHTHDLINREIDVAITSDALYEHDSIERHELVHERFILMLPRGASAQGGGLRETAAKLPFIRYTPRTQSGQLIEQHFRRLRLDFVPKFALESPEDLIAGVAAGYGWSVITPSQLPYSLSNADLVEFQPFPKPGLSRSITLITRKGEFPAIANQLSDLCRRVLREQILPRINALLPNVPDAFLLKEDDMLLGSD